MDLITVTERAPKEGETVTGTGFHMAPGGKGSNQVIQCARLGADVTIAGRIGNDDFGKALLAIENEAGVDTKHVTADPDESTGIAQITIETGGGKALNRIIVCLGANMKIDAEQLEWVKNSIAEYDMVMLQLEILTEINILVAKWAKDAGVPVMLNPAPAACVPAELMNAISYISPNEHEAALLSGRTIASTGNMHDVSEAAGWFKDNGAEKVIITLGENGSALFGPR